MFLKIMLKILTTLKTFSFYEWIMTDDFICMLEYRNLMTDDFIGKIKDGRNNYG